MTGPRDPQSESSLMTAVVLAVIAAVLLGGYFAFPAFQAYMARQDCIGAGRIDCDRY